MTRIFWERTKAKLVISSKYYFTDEEIAETIQKGTTLQVSRKFCYKYDYQIGGEYTGEWRGGFRDGIGTMIWPDGSRYEGYWLFGKPAETGTFTYHDGQSFTGEWKNDKLIIGSIEKQKSKNGFIWLLQKEKSTGYTPANKAKINNLVLA
jgi:hypothetical protein